MISMKKNYGFKSGILCIKTKQNSFRAYNHTCRQNKKAVFILVQPNCSNSIAMVMLNCSNENAYRTKL